MKYILLEARKRGLKDDLHWSKYNNILYSVFLDIGRELNKYFKVKGK